MILKHFLMGFGGVATVTGVGIGIYYGTNSSEEIKKDMDSLKLSDSEGKTSGKEDSEVNNVDSNSQTDGNAAS